MPKSGKMPLLCGQFALIKSDRRFAMSAITRIFGTHSERELKRIYPIVDKVESYRDAMHALSDDELKGKTKEFKGEML